MRAVFALAVAALCASQAFGFRMESFKAEAGEEVDEDVMEFLTQHMQHVALKDNDEQQQDFDKEDIDQVNNVHTDYDNEVIEEVHEDTDREITQESGNEELTRRDCRRIAFSCTTTSDCCRHLKCKPFHNGARICVYSRH